MGFLNWRCHEVSDLCVFDQTIVHCNIACIELNRTCSECLCCQRIAISISVRKYSHVKVRRLKYSVEKEGLMFPAKAFRGPFVNRRKYGWGRCRLSSANSCHYWANLSSSFSISLFRYQIILFVNKIYLLFWVYAGDWYKFIVSHGSHCVGADQYNEI